MPEVCVKQGMPVSPGSEIAVARPLYFAQVVRVVDGDDLELPPYPDEKTPLHMLAAGATPLPGRDARPLPKGLTIALEPFGHDEAGHLIAVVYLPRPASDDFLPK